MFKPGINNSSKKLWLQQKISETRAVNPHITPALTKRVHKKILQKDKPVAGKSLNSPIKMQGTWFCSKIKANMDEKTYTVASSPKKLRTLQIHFFELNYKSILTDHLSLDSPKLTPQLHTHPMSSQSSTFTISDLPQTTRLKDNKFPPNEQPTPLLTQSSKIFAIYAFTDKSTTIIQHKQLLLNQTEIKL